MGGGDVRLVSVDRAILGTWPCRFRLVDCHVPTGGSGYRFGRSRHITYWRQALPDPRIRLWNSLECPTGDKGRVRDDLIVNAFRSWVWVPRSWVRRLPWVSRIKIERSSASLIATMNPYPCRRLDSTGDSSRHQRLEYSAIFQAKHSSLCGGSSRMRARVWLAFGKSQSSTGLVLTPWRPQFLPKKNISSPSDLVTAACELPSDDGGRPPQRCVRERTLAQIFAYTLTVA